MKKTSKNILIYAGVLILGVLLGKWFFTSSTSEKSDNQETHEHQMQEEGEEVWTCSMHPQVREDQSGSCPICGMDLVKLDETDSGLDPKAIKMSERAMQLAKVATAFPSTTPQGDAALSLDGKLMFNQEMKHKLTAEFHGRIEVLNVDYEGQKINKGQVIAKVYSPELESLQRELLIAEKQKSENMRLYEASIRKLKNWNINQKEIDNIISTGEVQGTTNIRSPFSGIISNLSVREGSHVERGDLLFEVNDISQLWAEFEAYEKDAGKLQIGDVVSFNSLSYPSKIWESKIVFISPVLDNQRRSFQVRAEVDNSDLLLKPSSTIQGKIQQETTESTALWLPKSAVLWTGKRSVVYQQLEQNGEIGFLMKEVEIGKNSGDFVEILSGVSMEDEIAVNGVFSIDASAQISAKPSMMNRSNQTDSQVDVNWEEVQLETNTFKKVMQKYLSLKEAMAEDKEEEVFEIASDFQQQLGSLNFENSKAKKGLQQLVKDVSTSKNMELSRMHFQYLSNVMIALSQQENPLDETLYVQFCPMANNDEGAFWLSTETQIKNPYFGSKMLRCGSVTREIE
jgi:Cu(I)/Ag(I) efflux system membrane fusion protein